MMSDLEILRQLNTDEVKARRIMRYGWAVTEPEVTTAWNHTLGSLGVTTRDHHSRIIRPEIFTKLINCAEENFTVPDHIPELPSYLDKHARARWRLIYLHSGIPIPYIAEFADSSIKSRLAFLLDGEPLRNPRDVLDFSADARPNDGYALIDFKLRPIPLSYMDGEPIKSGSAIGLRRLDLPDFIQACLSYLMAKGMFPLPKGPVYHWALNHISGMNAFARIKRGWLGGPDYIEVKVYKKKKPRIKNRGLIAYEMCSMER